MERREYSRRAFVGVGGAALAAAGLRPLMDSAAADGNVAHGAAADASGKSNVAGTRRLREAGLRLGDNTPGPYNAITDVGGVRVSHSTIVKGEGPLVVGQGPVRTGVSVICPREGLTRYEPVFAGVHTLNGNGEMTGLEWIREAGVLSTPVALTNTHSVGVVRDALIAAELEARTDDDIYWSLPVVSETFDGVLSDINGQHVGPGHLREALYSARGGLVEEGAVGAGTGTICHGFKGGIGTSSRRLSGTEGEWTVGALVQANHGIRENLRVDGAPVGRVLDAEQIPLPRPPVGGQQGASQGASQGAGSIVVILATDAPLLPHQCERLAQRAGIGIGRSGGGLSNGSGDIFLAFATGNTGLPRTGSSPDPGQPLPVRTVPDEAIDPLFEAAADSTEEAILNALLMAGTVTGRDSVTAYGLSPELMLAALPQARELCAPTDNIG